MPRIRRLDFVKDPFECLAKLNSFGRGQANCLFVDLVEGAIVYQPQATVALRNAPQWGDTKVWKVLHRFKRQDSPEGLVIEICHLFADEVNMCFSGLVGTARGAFLYRSLSPIFVLHADRGAVGAQIIQELCGRVIDRPHFRMEV
jgi:hypothetical protein